jgi:hypothetical protein
MHPHANDSTNENLLKTIRYMGHPTVDVERKQAIASNLRETRNL